MIQVQESEHGRILPDRQSLGELGEERHAAEGAFGRAPPAPPPSGPRLNQPSAVAVDVVLHAVRYVPEQRHIKQLRGRDSNVLAVAAVRGRNRVADRTLHAGSRRIGVYDDGTRRQGAEPITLLAERMEDGRMACKVIGERYLVRVCHSREHRREAALGSAQRAKMIRIVGEAGPLAAEGWRRTPHDLGEHVRREHVKHDVDQVARAGELVDFGRRYAPGAVHCHGPVRRLCPVLQRQERGLQHHQQQACGWCHALHGSSEHGREAEHTHPQGNIERHPPCMLLQIEPDPGHQTVVGEQQVALNPEQYADGAEPGDVAREPPRRQEDPERHQEGRGRGKQPDPQRCQLPEGGEKLGTIRGVHRPGTEEQKLARAEERREKHGSQARPQLAGSEHSISRGTRPRDRDGEACRPGEQDEHRRRCRYRGQPVADRSRVFRIDAVGPERPRRCAGARPANIQASSAAVLPVNDLDAMRTGVELDAARRSRHADAAAAFEHDLAVQPDGHAVVGRGVELDGFRARRPPHAGPADKVVAGRVASLANEREIDRRRPFFDDGRDASVDDRRGRAVEQVIAAGEAGRGRQDAGE